MSKDWQEHLEEIKRLRKEVSNTKDKQTNLRNDLKELNAQGITISEISCLRKEIRENNQKFQELEELLKQTEEITPEGLAEIKENLEKNDLIFIGKQGLLCGTVCTTLTEPEEIIKRANEVKHPGTTHGWAWPTQKQYEEFKETNGWGEPTNKWPCDWSGRKHYLLLL